jgi:NTE family protein
MTIRMSSKQQPGDPSLLLSPRFRRRGTIVVATLMLACATAPPDNQRVEAGPIGVWTEHSRIASEQRSGRLLLILTFSGGGTRAAAFSYGVLQELANTKIRLGDQDRSLLDEIDLISSVSGGSFTAAYYGLHRDEIFADFEEVFLRKNVQRRLLLEALRPFNWLRLKRLDRSQLAARYYDRNIFNGASFGDMRRPGGPEIVMNATDLSSGSRFAFSPQFFAFICSDLDSYPVADAVTASSAVPVVFPTVRLHNYAGTCGFQQPAWVAQSGGDGEESPLRQVLRGQILDAASAIEQREYIHFLDGGLSDNLGLANSIAALAMLGDPQEAVRDLGHGDLELILVISVNAEAETEHGWDRLDRAVSARNVVKGLTSAQMTARNKLALSFARASFSELARVLSTPDRPVHSELIEVSFDKVSDPAERAGLRKIETSFRLSDQKVDSLLAAARGVVRDSPALSRALSRFDGVDR